MGRKALFIINPISGGKKKDGVPELIEKYLDANNFEATIVFSDGVAHARQIAKEAVNTFEVVVAVGGDAQEQPLIAGSRTTRLCGRHCPRHDRAKSKHHD